MKITVEKSALGAALERVSPAAAGAKAAIPVLAFVHLRAADGEARLFSSNLDWFIQTAFAAETDRGGECLIPYADLRTLAKGAPDGAQIEIEVVGAEGGKNENIVVRAGRSRYSLPTLPVADYPLKSTPPPAEGGPLPATALRRLFHTVAYAISSEETRYYLNGIHLRAAVGDAGDTLVAEATDGHRLAKAVLAMPAGFTLPEKGVIIPGYVARAMLAMLAKAAEDQEVELRLDDNAVMFEIGDTVTNARLIDGTFPDCDRVIPEISGKTVTADRAHLVGALERIGAFAGVSARNGRLIKFTPQAADGLELSAEREGGSADEAVDAEIAAGVEIFGCNPSYLAATVGHLTGDRVTLDQADAATPIRIEDTAAEGLEAAIHVVMPGRV